MMFRIFDQSYQKLLLLFSACILPVTAIIATEDVIAEKRTGVAMRMIGHEVLMCVDDYESRIMPIEKVDDHYKISFEFDFGFDPEDIISIVESVMTETKISSNYLVEVERCENNAVVHSFEVGNAVYASLKACGGRILPKDCYNLLITLLDGTKPVEKSPDVMYLTSPNAAKSKSFESALLMVPLVILIGFIGYFITKKKPVDLDPNLIWVGASLFDKRNMTLSFGNKSIDLSNKEAELLTLLHKSANTPVERATILQRVWGDDGDYIGRTLDVFISKLRKKLEADESLKIVNIRGIGYKLVTDVPA